MITQEQMQKMIDGIDEKAARHIGGEIIIRPSEYGIVKSSEATRKCVEMLQELHTYKSVKLLGKDMIEIIV